MEKVGSLFINDANNDDIPYAPAYIPIFLPFNYPSWKIGNRRTNDGIEMKLSPSLLNILELLSLLLFNKLFTNPNVPEFPKLPKLPNEDNIDDIFTFDWLLPNDDSILDKLDYYYVELFPNDDNILPKFDYYYWLLLPNDDNILPKFDYY